MPDAPTRELAPSHPAARTRCAPNSTPLAARQAPPLPGAWPRSRSSPGRATPGCPTRPQPRRRRRDRHSLRRQPLGLPHLRPIRRRPSPSPSPASTGSSAWPATDGRLLVALGDVAHWDAAPGRRPLPQQAGDAPARPRRRRHRRHQRRLPAAHRAGPGVHRNPRPHGPSSTRSPLASREDLLDNASRAPVIKLVNLILFEAVKSNASDVHVQPYEDRLLVRTRIDGVLYDSFTLPKTDSGGSHQPGEGDGADEHRREAAEPGRPRDGADRPAHRRPAHRQPAHQLRRAHRHPPARQEHAPATTCPKSAWTRTRSTASASSSPSSTA